MVHRIPSLRGDVVFKLTHVPKASTEKKLQTILDSRLQGAFICLWNSRRMNIAGRLSVPRNLVEANPEFMFLCSAERGTWFMIGPHKVYLELDRSDNIPSAEKRKVLRMTQLEDQVKSLMHAVQTLTIRPAVPLTESRQQTFDIAPVQPPRDSLYQPALKRSLSKESVLGQKKKKKRKARKKKVQSLEQKLDLKMNVCVQRLLKDSEAASREEEKRKQEFHAQKLEELNKNLKLYNTLGGVETID